MKIERKNGNPPIVIGKRITVGAAITSTLAVLSHFWPEHSSAMAAAAVPVTFIIQVWLANKFGVTSAE